MMTGRNRDPESKPAPTVVPPPTIINITNITVSPSSNKPPHPPIPEPLSSTDSDKIVVEIDPQEEWKKAWKEFDPSLKSSITPAKFHQLLQGLGEVASDAEVEELINSVDGEDKITCKSCNITRFLAGRCGGEKWNDGA